MGSIRLPRWPDREDGGADNRFMKKLALLLIAVGFTSCGAILEIKSPYTGYTYKVTTPVVEPDK